MSNQLTTMIRRLENELTAIKTAHLHGLGTASFYSASDTKTFNYHEEPTGRYPNRTGIILKITVSMPSAPLPFFQPSFFAENEYSSHAGSVYGMTYGSNKFSWVFRSFNNRGPKTLSLTFRLVSTVNFSDITFEDITDD